jgi:hypothetical protein
MPNVSDLLTFLQDNALSIAAFGLGIMLGRVMIVAYQSHAAIERLHSEVKALRRDTDRLYVALHDDKAKRKNKPLMYLTSDGELSASEHQEPDLYEEKNLRG